MLIERLTWVAYKLLNCLERTSDKIDQEKEFIEIEVRRLCFLSGTGMSICCIAKEILRSKTAVETAIKRGTDGSAHRRVLKQN